VPVDREVQHERRGHRIEQLGVVEPEHDLAPVRARAQRIRAAAHELERVVRADVVGNEAREGSQRHGGGAGRGLHPAHQRARARPLGLRVGLTGQPRLADARAGADHHAAARRVGASVGDRGQLRFPADQRPGGGKRGRDR
jgi:hypothetical protein